MNWKQQEKALYYLETYCVQSIGHTVVLPHSQMRYAGCLWKFFFLDFAVLVLIQHALSQPWITDWSRSSIRQWYRCNMGYYTNTRPSKVFHHNTLFAYLCKFIPQKLKLYANRLIVRIILVHWVITRCFILTGDKKVILKKSETKNIDLNLARTKKIWL